MSAMRTSLWPGLIQAARGNLARQQERLRLFESGLRFQQDPAGLRQEGMLAGLLLGKSIPEQWGAAAHAADFFDTTEADWDYVMSVDLKGAFMLSQSAARVMVSQGCLLYTSPSPRD